MPGRGPAPKDPDKRARRNKDPHPFKVIHVEPSAQPELPDFDVTVKEDGELRSEQFDWPERTRDWWRMWAESPLAEDFTATDWNELMDTALLHAKFWGGNMGVAAELRLRVAKFGATPEDRARLRIQFAAADQADNKRTNKPTTGGTGSGGLRLVD